MNAGLPTLDMAVATHGPDGLQRLLCMLLPPIDGIRYVVSWQNHENAPVSEAIAARGDVEIHRIEGGGLAVNRNNAMRFCTADIILQCDNDLEYYPEGLEQVRRVFQQQPDLDVATLRSDHGDPARFPGRQVTLKGKLPKNYFVTSFEIALRRSSAGGLRFAEEFGLGAPELQCGEDEVFLLTAMRAGYCCRFVPITICAHPHPSTGLKSRFTSKNLMGMGATIRLLYPRSFSLRLLIKARRVSSNGQASFLSALRWLTTGALRAPSMSDILRRCNH